MKELRRFCRQSWFLEKKLLERSVCLSRGFFDGQTGHAGHEWSSVSNCEQKKAGLALVGVVSARWGGCYFPVVFRR